MGYYLQAFIGQTNELNKIHLQYSISKLILLDQGISMIPLTEELFYQIYGKNEPEWILPGEENIQLIETAVLKVIDNSKLAYVEAHYWGGDGWQMGLIWEDGKRILELDNGQDRINEILRSFNIHPVHEKDEFETVGLKRGRHTRDW